MFQGKRSSLTIALVTILMSVTIVVGGTYALFSSEVTVNNHLAAGSLKVGLTRTHYKEYVIDGQSGLMIDKENSEEVDLTKDNSYIFNIVNGVPSGYYEATIKTTNLSTIAFDYGVRLIVDTESSDKAFLEQIKITVIKPVGEESSFMLDDVKDVNLGYLNSLQNASFTIRALFVNDTTVNNKAMLLNALFDLQVFAVQKTEI